MPRIRRGNYVFVQWIGDHGRHVHVYSGRLVLKWDVETWSPIKGQPTRRILRILEELMDEGKI